MQKAKAAVSDILHKDKKHTVDVDQESNPAVVHERIAPEEHHDVTKAIDREVHQHHHQTHVQPIQDSVVESEQHHHKVAAVEERHHHHGKDEEINRTLAERNAGFQNEREVLPTQTGQSHQTVVGEHVHHHIHDTVQPVIERETIQPSVVHTTVPVHERIDKEPQVHQGNVLPTMTMDEFSSTGGHHGKKTHEHIDYEGEPLDIKNQNDVSLARERGI